jgi:hypothetical protein
MAIKKSKARKRSVWTSRELQKHREFIIKTYNTDKRIEGLLFPALALVSMLHTLAEAGSVKATKSLCGLVGIGNRLVEKLKASNSE